MRSRRSWFRPLPVGVIALGLVVAACEDDADRMAPPGPRFAGGPVPESCDLKDEIQLAKGYFPGSGAGSLSKQADELLKEMQEQCAGGATDNAASYTANWFILAGLFEQALESAAAGAPADGNQIARRTIGLQDEGGNDMFDPCPTDLAADITCSSWEGHTTDPQPHAHTPPDFTDALSSGGLWGVIGDGVAAGVSFAGADAICSGHVSPASGEPRVPCPLIDPSVEDEDVWGFRPEKTWVGTLSGATSLMYGAPLSDPSPTGEAAWGFNQSAYEANLIPDWNRFPAGEGMVIGICTVVEPANGAPAIQKGNSALEARDISDWCVRGAEGHVDAGDDSWLGRLARLARALVAPARPLYAIAAVNDGLGGGASTFSEFFGIDANLEGALEISNLPIQDGVVDMPIVGKDGVSKFVITARTTSAGPGETTTVESLELVISLKDNNGATVDFNAEGVDCSNGSTCTGTTEGDAQGNPGTLTITKLTVNKTGAYRLCVNQATSGSQFAFPEFCSEKFNIRPS